jgi:putative transposase
MFNLISALLHSIFKIVFTNRKDLIFTLMILKKENQIYKRQLNHKKVHNSLKRSDRFFLTLIFKLSKRATNHLTIVKPSTLLDWQRRFVKNFWSYKHKTPGRKPVTRDIKNLILDMKQENYLWGCKKISNELKKINIDIHYTTVNRIISTFRKQGLIQPKWNWK